MLSLLAALAVTALPEDAVVRIQTYSARHDWSTPWRLLPADAGVGSGFVIGPGRVVTNAHVVRDAREVLVKRHHVADPFIARIEAVGDDCDLAVLRVEDPAFMKGIQPLAVGELPKARSQVVTYGYPLGGQEISSTRGIVSRVEWLGYVHSAWDAHMVVLTDAAINPGNSGGPVIQGGKVVGVAFQGSAALQSIGYFIPPVVLRHFLDDLKDGRYDGFPDSGFNTTDLLSPAYRRERGMPPEMSGVVVDGLAPGGTAETALRAGDVIVRVEGQPVANDGTIALGEARITFQHLLDAKQVGESVRFQIFRDGKLTEVSGVARRIARGDRARNRYGVAPRFYLYAGLVFMPLDRELLKTFGEEWPSSAPRSYVYRQFFREAEDPANADEETVVLSRVLQHPINSQMSIQSGIVRSVNGVEVHGLKELALAFDAARAKKGFVLIGFEAGGVEALDLSEAEAAHKAILKLYGVSRDKNL